MSTNMLHVKDYRLSINSRFLFVGYTVKFVIDILCTQIGLTRLTRCPYVNDLHARQSMISVHRFLYTDGRVPVDDDNKLYCTFFCS